MIQMGKWNRNGEGYADITASIAIKRASEAERKIAMAKRRSCRRTADENIIHEKAVKLRKMTDEQLAHYVEDRVEKARSEGFARGRAKASEYIPINMDEVMKEIESIQGIGAVKRAAIKTVLKKTFERN